MYVYVHHVNQFMAQSWKWIRVHEDVYDDISAMGEFKESFNDILRRLVSSYNNTNNDCGPSKNRPTGVTTMGRDVIKARLKKFDSHTKAIARLTREHIKYSAEPEPGPGPERVEGD
jgi:negative regulator of replication initiation